MPALHIFANRQEEILAQEDLILWLIDLNELGYCSDYALKREIEHLLKLYSVNGDVAITGIGRA